MVPSTHDCPWCTSYCDRLHHFVFILNCYKSMPRACFLKLLDFGDFCLVFGCFLTNVGSLSREQPHPILITTFISIFDSKVIGSLVRWLFLYTMQNPSEVWTRNLLIWLQRLNLLDLIACTLPWCPEDLISLNCDALCDFGSVTIWRLHGRSSACKCMLTLCSTFHIVFIRLHELAWHSKGSIKCQTFECHSNG